MMTPGNTDPVTRNIDPQWVAAVVREVVARLRAAKTPHPGKETAVAIQDRIVTAETIVQIKGTPAEVTIPARAVITPSARDEAKQRGIKLSRIAAVSKSPRREPAITTDEKIRITDAAQPERAIAVAAQIAKRGVTALAGEIVLSETPAADVYHRSVVGGGRAVMINSLGDVDRFAAELNPDVWVLDMARINFITAVNVVVRIAKYQG